jgi:hypothetical protein
MRWLLKRWWFWAGTGFMLVAVCAGYLLIPVAAEEGRISQATCDRIQLGWTVGEVISLLGENGLVGGNGNGLVGGIDGVEGFEMPCFRWWAWHDDDDNVIVVRFSEQGVATKHFVASGLSIYERMKRRVERRIRALWP